MAIAHSRLTAQGQISVLQVWNWSRSEGGDGFAPQCFLQLPAPCRQYHYIHVAAPCSREFVFQTVDVNYKLVEQALGALLMLMDETGVQVLQSEKSATSEHYMWVRLAVLPASESEPERRIVLFTYSPYP
jgi:hypothetical protein